MVYSNQILHTHAYQNCLTNAKHFLMDKALLSISQAGYGHLMKLLITLESDDIFRSNFAYLFIITLFRQ